MKKRRPSKAMQKLGKRPNTKHKASKRGHTHKTGSPRIISGTNQTLAWKRRNGIARKAQ